MYLLVINGFSLYRTDGTDDILLKLKKKKSIYIRNIIRELSKDVFHLFYLFQPIDITRIFTRTDA